MIAVLFLWFPALAQTGDPPAPEPLILTYEQAEYALGLHLGILEDPGGKLTIDQVSSPEFDSQFTPSQAAVPNFGFTDSAYWVRLRLDNQTHQIDEWLLEVGFANMQYVDLYTSLPDNEGFNVKQTGVLRPVSTRDFLYPHIILNLIVPNQSQQTTYLRFKNGASMTLPLTLWTKDAFFAQAQRIQIAHWLLYGALIALLAYHLFLLFTLREASYLYFVILLASLIATMLAYDGYMGVYIFPNLFFIKPFFLPLSYSLLLASIVLFSDAFLELRTRLPILHRVNIVFVAVWGVLMLLTPFTSYHFMANLETPWALFSLIVVLVAGIASWQQGSHPAWFFLIAWIGMIASFLLVILVRLAIIPSTSFDENIYRIGFFWMAVCWSIALADRINLLKTETERANRGLQHSQHRLTQILEGLPIGVMEYGRERKPTYFNRRLIEIFSSQKGEIRPDPADGRTLEEAQKTFSFRVSGSENEYPLDRLPISQAFEGKPVSADDIEADLIDRRVQLEMWANPVRDDQGQIETVVAAVMDISQKKKDEAELVKYRENLEQLVAKRTDELISINKLLQTEITERQRLQEEIHLRLEWLVAVNQANEKQILITDLPQVNQNFCAIIQNLFGASDAFIAMEDPNSAGKVSRSGRELRQEFIIRTHSAQGDQDLDWMGTVILLPAAILSNHLLEQEKPWILSRDQLDTLNGRLNAYLQATESQYFLFMPLQFQERVIGLLGLVYHEAVRFFSASDNALLKKISDDIALIEENTWLIEQSQALVAAEERNRLARDLHDSVTQTLFTASVLAEATPRIWEKDRGIAHQNMEKLSLLIRGALAEMRSMLIELRSEGLLNQSLDQLLITLVEAARARSRAVIIASIMDIPELPQNVTLIFYRIAREAINNALIHAAAAQIYVSLHEEHGQIEVRIRDDGCGFDPQTVETGHLGISIMVERAAQIGGDVQVHSKPSHGTEIVITWSRKGGELTEND